MKAEDRVALEPLTADLPAEPRAAQAPGWAELARLALVIAALVVLVVLVATLLSGVEFG